MTNEQWTAFSSFCDTFRQQVQTWNNTFSVELAKLQTEAAVASNTPSYPVQTPIVYNRALDEVTPESVIKLIVIGDNPGKNEQLTVNNRYLVGQAGKLGDGFFRKNEELGIDFRSNVIILNKTPIHSAKTKQLSYIASHGSTAVRQLIIDTQIWMAQRTAALHNALCTDSECGLWLVGYSELKGSGLFLPYRDALIDAYSDSNYYSSDGRNQQVLSNIWNSVKVYQHFSMNRFSIDLNEYIKKLSKNSTESTTSIAPTSSTDSATPLRISLDLLGTLHRQEIFNA